MSACRAPLTVLAALTAAAVLAGCGSTSGDALHSSLSALQATTPAQPPSKLDPERDCKDPTASLRPRGALPAPAEMPAGSFMATIARHGKLIAGVDQNTLLLAYRNPINGQLEGFEIDLLHELARALLGDPDKVEFKALTTAQRLDAVENGTVDVVADAVSITCYRRTRVSFSAVYYDAAQRVLVPKTSTARSIRDLGGKRVCATRGSTTIARLAKLSDHVIPYAVAQRTDCLVGLQEGEVDAISSDDAILLGYKAQDPYTKIVGPSLADEPYGMAISRAHPDFVRFVNAVLARMRADGRWAAIYRRWLGPYQPPQSPPRARYRD
jgi:polar amino acid transport system substrate-binding protein